MERTSALGGQLISRYLLEMTFNNKGYLVSFISLSG
jgi:hypothetical protein